MQRTITQGALLSRQLVDAGRPYPESAGGFVADSRLAALAGMPDQALRPDITVCTDIAHDLGDFVADPEKPYFAVLNLCRNAAGAVPDGGAITVGARKVERCAGAARGFVEIVVADGGEGMTEEVFSQAFTPYFTAAGGGTGLVVAQVQRFVEERGGAVGIESKLAAAGTLVQLFRLRVGDVAVLSNLAGTQTTYTPSPNGGVFHVNTWRPVERWSS